MKTTYYFSHDFNTRTDKKIKLLLKRFSWYGYGLFWAIVEDLYNNANALPLDYDSIAFDLRTDNIAMIEAIINDFELFENDGKVFWSNSVQRRLDEREDKSVKARESANKRWENANAMRTQSKGNAIKEKKGKEIKGKEINETNGDECKEVNLKNSNLFRQPNVPTYEQVYEVFFRNGGTEEMAKSFFNKWEGTGWFLNGSPIINFVKLAENYILTYNKNKTEKNGTKSRAERHTEGLKYLLKRGQEEYAKVMAINQQNKANESGIRKDTGA
jgi:hypothetical protein